MKEHETFSGFICEFCNMSFESYEDQRLHNCLEIKIEKPEFDQQSDYDINQQIKQENFDTGFSYDEKETTLSKKLSKKLKSRTIISSGVHEKVKNWKCLQCPAAFCQRSQLNKHSLSVHEKYKPHQCDQCQKSFPRCEIFGFFLLSFPQNE